MTSLVRHLLNLAKKTAAVAVSSLDVFWKSDSLCLIHLALSFLTQRLSWRMLQTATSQSAHFESSCCIQVCGSAFTILATADILFFSCLWLSLGDLERWQFSSPCPEKESMPSSDGCMWRNFELDNFPQIFMTFQCVVSELCLCKTVAAFALLNEMLCF